MSDAMNPMDAGRQKSSTRTASANAETSSILSEERRPALVTFAAVMMFLVGGFQFVFAITEFWNAVWFATSVFGTFGGRLWLWGIVDMLLAFFAFYAGADLLRGGTFGRVYALIIAGLSAIRWFFYIPSAPVAGLVFIAVDVLIMYGLLANSEYFDNAQLY